LTPSRNAWEGVPSISLDSLDIDSENGTEHSSNVALNGLPAIELGSLATDAENDGKEQSSSDVNTAFNRIIGMSENGHGIVTVTQVDSQGRKYSRCLMKLARFRTKKVSDDQIKERARTFVAGLVLMGEEHGDHILAEVAKRRDFLLLSKDKLPLSVDEAIVARDLMHTSTNAIVKLASFTASKGIPLFVPQLKKMIGKKEKESGLPIGVKGFDLIVNKNPHRTKPCTFSWVKSPHSVVELLVESCVKAGKFEDSILFSRLERTLVPVFGCDRSKGDVTMLIRIANRKDGNNKMYCQPLSHIEHALECLENLMRTMYEKKYPTQPFLQDLVDDRLHAILLRFMSPEGKVAACRCTLVKILPDLDMADWLSFADPAHGLFDVSVSLSQREGGSIADDGQTNGAQRSFYVPAHVLRAAKCGNCDTRLSLQLIHRDVTGYDETVRYCIGFQLFHDDDLVLSFRFRVSFVLSTEWTLDLECLRVVGFPAHDTKQALLVSGQGGASDSCPCLVCVALSKNFNDPPKWMYEFDPYSEFLEFWEFFSLDQFSETNETREDAPLRQGEFANEHLHGLWLEFTGRGKYKASNEAALRAKQTLVYSLTHPPQLNIALHKDPLAPMHSMQGLFTHMSDAIRDQLRAIDDEDSEWMSLVKSTLEQATHCSKETAEFKSLHKEFMKHERNLKRFEESFRKALSKSPSNEHSIQTLRQKIAETKASKEAHANNTEYGLQVKLINGAKVVVKGVEEYLKAKSRKSRGESEFTFNRGIEERARVQYQQQNSGTELTNRDAMKALAVWDAICDIVGKCYADEPNRQARVMEVMENSKGFATPLFELNKLLMTQGRQTEDCHDRIRQHLIDVFIAWRRHFPEKNVFLKMHHLIAHVIFFIVEHEMLYRLSEEGFESFQSLMDNVKTTFASVVPEKRRFECIYHRLQVSMDERIEAERTTYESVMAKGTRGPYNTIKATRMEEDLELKKETRTDKENVKCKAKGGLRSRFKDHDK
jgi:hypothetical protein